MNEMEQYNFYKELEQTKVSVKTEEHKMVHAGHYYTDTIYSFGPYQVVKTRHAENSKFPSRIYITIFKNNQPLAQLNNESEQSPVWDMWVAAKNKYKGESFRNPFNTPGDFRTIMYKFEQEIPNVLVKILPADKHKSINNIKLELKKVFANMVKQYQ